jgi:hypothetical protein
MPQESGALNAQQLQDTAMNTVETFCSIFAMPVEVILRPRYGTRYFSPPIVFFSAAVMLFLPLISATATAVTNIVPFMARVVPAQAMFDLASFSKLYFLLCFVHGFRLYRRMLRMELEAHSEFEGPPLPFFHLIPGSKSFWFTRIVLESAFVLIAAILLQNLFIIQSGLASFLEFAALCLAMKNFIGWYRGWEFLRKILDTRNAGPIIAKLVEDRATQDDLAQIHIASFPKNISPDLRQAAAAHIARVYSPDSTITDSNPTGDSHATH